VESDFTIKNLRDVEDSAVKFGFSERQEAHFARQALDAETTGFAYHVLKPGRRQAFGHRHTDAEEVYVAISGAGRVRLDDEVVEVGALDAIRVAPQVTRAFEAGPEGLALLVFGPHHPEDGELLHDFWPD
jgi:mannose-6-phosphate isomerase-like protein (cupin superfamily)